MTKKIYLIRHAQSEANAALDLDNNTFYYDAKFSLATLLEKTGKTRQHAVASNSEHRCARRKGWHHQPDRNSRQQNEAPLYRLW